MESVWRATRELGLSIRKAQAAEIVRSALPLGMNEWSPVGTQLNEVFAGFGSITTQLLMMSHSLKQIRAADAIAGTAEGGRFMAAASQVYRGSVGMIEWVRSRIEGYPRLLVPHIDAVGPYSDRHCMPGNRVHWIAQLRGTGIQLSTRPVRPEKPFGPGAPTVIEEQLVTLVAALRECSKWNLFLAAKSRLSSDALAELTAARQKYWQLASGQVLEQEAGTRLVRRLHYLSVTLNKVRAELSAESREYWDAFEALDSQMEDVWRVIAHIALRESVLRIADYSALRWNPANQELEVSLKGDPFTFVPGSLVALPPSTVPEGKCALVNAVTMTFPSGSVALDLILKVLPNAWPILGDI